MKIKILQKTFTGTGRNLEVGEKIEVDDRTANRLIRAGFAEEVKRSAPKKTNRAVFDINTPEDEDDI